MENANPFVHVPPNGLHARITQELNELRAISCMIDSHLKNVDHTMLPNEIDMDDLEFEDKLTDTPFVSPFLDLYDESADGEVLNELDKYRNAGNFYPDRIINIFDREDLAFSFMISFRKTRKYGKDLVAIVRDVYVFVGSFTYVMDFVVLEDIGEFIISDMADVMMGRTFRAVT
ncbi:hypothetical protein Tco_0680506 [Tanacetum coccineum]|uniref:Uncharacterized protein n=1 Tax=Tanacetum coccineum TaxID=301880 RepID=A0ABQ4XKT0_9ASTR